MLIVHQWFMYTVLALEVVPQTALITVLSAVAGFLVWWSQLSAINVREASDAHKEAHKGEDHQGADGSTDSNSALIALVGWCARPPRCSLTRRRLQPHAPRLQPHAPSLQTHALGL